MKIVDVCITVNGTERTAKVEARRTLADCLRHDFGLTGTHVGCEHGVCGACTVIVNGNAMRSCLLLAVQADGWNIQTVESLSSPDELSPLQEAFRDNHALQCGFCTPGILMTAEALLAHEPDASEDRIVDVLSGHICRCTGYLPIVKAIVQARDFLASRTGAGK